MALSVSINEIPASSIPVVLANFLLLVDGVSFLLLMDGVSYLELASSVTTTPVLSSVSIVEIGI